MNQEDQDKTKEQLILELQALRQQRQELEQAASDLRRAEGSLREREESYRLLAENMVDVIWTMDMKLNFTYVSPSIERLRGYSVEQAMTQSMEDMLTPSSLEAALQFFAEETYCPKDLRTVGQVSSSLEGLPGALANGKDYRSYALLCHL